MTQPPQGGQQPPEDPRGVPPWEQGAPPQGGQYGAQQGQYGPQQGQYGAPAGGPPPNAPGAGTTASVGDAVKYGWEAYRGALGPWILAVLVLFVVSGALGALTWWATPEPEIVAGDGFMPSVETPFSPVAELLSVLQFLVSGILIASFISVALKVTEGRRIELGTFTQVPSQAIVVSLVVSAALYVLSWLPFVGALIQMVGSFLMMFAIHVAAATGAGIGDAVQRSFSLVTAHIGTCLLLLLLTIGLALGTAITVGLGAFVTVPLGVIASAYVFRRISGGPVQVPASAG